MTVAQTTTKELTENIVARMEATLNQAIPLLPKSFLRVLARTVAGVYILLYKYIGFGTLQAFVRTASSQPTTVNGRVLTPLTEWGRLIGVGDPASATQAELEIEITVDIQTGVLASGAQLIYAPTGITYLTIGAVALDAPTVTAIVRAVSDQSGGNGAGAIGNVPNGEILSFANPLSNVAQNTVVTGGITAGADAEDPEVYRQRIVDRFRQRPQGGALTDYRIWGEEPAGILNVYPYRSATCPGQVVLYVEATPESSGDPDGIPTPSQLQEVLDSVEFDQNGLATRRPVGALVQALPIARTEFEVNVNGLVVDDQAAVEADITQAIQEYGVNREPYIVGLDLPPRADRVTNSAISGVVDDVVSAAGGTFTNIQLTQGLSSVTIYALGPGEKVKIDTITFS